MFNYYSLSYDVASGSEITPCNKIDIIACEFVTRSCLKPQNPCSNHEIHVLFEHDFYLKKPKLGPDFHACRYTRMHCGRD